MQSIRNNTNLQTCNFPVNGPTAPVGGRLFKVQATLVKLAAHMGGQGLAEPALEVTLVDVCQVIGQRAVEVSPTCLVVFLCCRLDVAHDLGDQLFALSVGLVPGVQERCPLQRVVVGLLVEFLRVAQEAGDVSIGQDAPASPW